MLVIEELRLTAIGRFVEEQVIEFKKLGNLVQVDGLRNDTGGSSGSGKSTVFNSLDYLFGLNDIPSSVLQSRYTKDSISVTMIGKYDGKPLTITRGKGKLSVDLDGDITTGSKLAEEKIDQILGMPRNLFRPLLHKRQKEGGFFLQFTPKEVHEFLTDCLGLGQIRKKQEIVDKKLKSLTDELAMAQSLLRQAESAREATESAAIALGSAPVKEIDRETILALKKAYDAALEALAPLKTRHSVELQGLELTRPMIKSVSYDLLERNALRTKIVEHESAIKSYLDAEVTRQSLIRQQIADLRVEKTQLEALRAQGSQAMVEAARLTEEVKKIRASICPTCEQTWLTEQAKEREQLLIEKIRAFGKVAAQAENAGTRLVTVIGNLELLTKDLTPVTPPEITPLRAQIAVLKEMIAQDEQKQAEQTAASAAQARVEAAVFAQAQQALLERHSAELQQVNGQIDVTRRTFESAAQKLKAYEDARVRYETTHKSLLEQHAKYKADTVKYQQQAEALSKDLLYVEELKRAIKSYTSVAFDESLEYIGAAATEIIRAIPNMANATIQLEGVRETKEGKVKEEVNAVISMDGETGIPIKSLSGGERSSVDLAVDLAVIDLLENRTNKGIDVFILDEPFTGLDTISIEMAIEKLKSLNKRLVIVDHNEEIKQMVESRLLVVRDGATSKIVQS